MLRFDECYPATERDSGLIKQGSGTRTIKLKRMVADSDRDHPPSYERWDLFVWNVCKGTFTSTMC